jgi:biotin transport system ATP-binding protein
MASDEKKAKLFEAIELARRFPGHADYALGPVSFRVDEGDFIVISGANGSGKSVLMHLVARLDTPTAGRVEYAGGTADAARIGLVFQDADAQILGDTVAEDVGFGPANLGAGKAERAEITSRVLSTVGLSGRGGEAARTLSGGEKRRLAVAGVLAMDARTIIFDEPFANLDWPGVVQVNSILRALKAEGKTVIVLTHELEKVLALANRLLVLYRGALVYDGTPGDALASAPLESWGIRHPLARYAAHEDLIWGNP